MVSQIKAKQKNMLSDLKLKIKNKEARICVVGLGYVGLPLLVAFAEAGHPVLGLEISKKKFELLSKGKSPVQGVEDQRIKKLIKSKKLKFASTFSAIKTQDVVIICVPTPLSKSWDPDLSFIMSATLGISENLKKSQLIILESTTYPGTTEEILLTEFEKDGLQVGRDFYLCFSPERIDPGNANFDTSNIPKVVGGVTNKCTELGSILYKNIVKEVVTVSSPRAAEMSKLLENTFRIVNIGLINELAKAAEDLNIDIWEVIEAAKTKPFGFMPFYPGPGIGGHCIGVDPMYLSWKAKFHGQELRFIDLARQVNESMPGFVVGNVATLLNEKQKSISGSKILLIGVSYKKDVDDVRESPAIEIIEMLQSQGAIVEYHDPFVPKLHWEEIRLLSKPLTKKTLSDSDLVLITTDHTDMDYESIVEGSKVIFDTRNILRNKGFISKNINTL